MIERLLESWLDRQSERRYQGPFIQLLISHGWQILHNTRHSPIEFGRDVIARDPSGLLYAFQLKGNPGSRLTKSQAQEILPQLIELVDIKLPSNFLEDSQERHHSVLVTNGEVDEEAQLLLSSLDGRAANPLSPSQSFSVWSRGRLLGMLNEKSGHIWPSSIEGIRAIASFFLTDGHAIPDPCEISDALEMSFPALSGSESKREIDDRLTTLFLVSELIKSSYYEADNHYSLYLITLISICLSLRLPNDNWRIRIRSDYANIALGHCEDLLQECKKLEFDPDYVYSETGLMDEVDVMSERRRLVGDCAATMVLADRFNDSDRIYIRHILSSSLDGEKVWGEGLMPSQTIRFLALMKLGGGLADEMSLARRLFGILNLSGELVSRAKPLPSPYFSFRECLAYHGVISVGDNAQVLKDRHAGRSWISRPIFEMLVRRNLKRTARMIWPYFSRIVHESLSLDHYEFLSPRLTTKGANIASTFMTGYWPDILREATSIDCSHLEVFKELPWLLGGYVSIVPYRYGRSVSLWLDRHYGTIWYR